MSEDLRKKIDECRAATGESISGWLRKALEEKVQEDNKKKRKATGMLS